MDIKEAIIHARQVAEGCGVDSRDCAYQHDCLADWLEELQAYRALGTVEELTALVKARDEGPCGPCRFNPPSSCDGKPCTMCPAEAALGGVGDG